jgi:hypothetical protein
MKQLLFVFSLLLFALSAFSQPVKSSGIWYFADAPNIDANPPRGVEVAYSINEQKIYVWDRDITQWVDVVDINSLSDEDVEDIVAALFLRSTHEGLGVTYDDILGTLDIDFVGQADDIPIVDAGSLYIATDVEAALQEEAVNRLALDALVGSLISLTGVPFSSTTLGTFVNPILLDNAAIKPVFEAFADSVDARLALAGAIPNLSQVLSEGANAGGQYIEDLQLLSWGDGTVLNPVYLYDNAGELVLGKSGQPDDIFEFNEDFDTDISVVRKQDLDLVSRSANIKNTIFAAQDAPGEPLRNSILNPFPDFYGIVDSLESGDNVQIFQGNYQLFSPYLNPLSFLNKRDSVSYSFVGQSVFTANSTNQLAPLFSDGGNFATASKRIFLLDAPYTDFYMFRSSGSFAAAFAFHNFQSEVNIKARSLVATGGRAWALHCGARVVKADIGYVKTSGGIALSVWQTLKDTPGFTGTIQRDINVKIDRLETDNLNDKFGVVRVQTGPGSLAQGSIDSLSRIKIDVGSIKHNNNGVSLLLQMGMTKKSIIDVNIDKVIGTGVVDNAVMEITSQNNSNLDSVIQSKFFVKIGEIQSLNAPILKNGASDPLHLDSSSVYIEIERAFFTGSNGTFEPRLTRVLNGSRYTIDCKDCRHNTGSFFILNTQQLTTGGGLFEIKGSYKNNDATTVLELSTCTADILLSAKLYNSTGTNLVTASSPRTINVTRESNVRQFNVGPNVTVNVLGAEKWTSETFTAVAAQVDFTVSAAKLPTATANVRVFNDTGARLRLTDHYTYVASTGVVTLVTPATAGEKISIEYFQ